MSVIEELAGMTDTDRVTRIVNDAINRLHRLETEAASAFAQWEKARAEAREAGITVDVVLRPGIAAALAEFRRKDTPERVRWHAGADDPPLVEAKPRLTEAGT